LSQGIEQFSRACWRANLLPETHVRSMFFKLMEERYHLPLPFPNPLASVELPERSREEIEPRPAEGYALYCNEPTSEDSSCKGKRVLAGGSVSTGTAAMMTDMANYYSMLARARLIMRNDTLSSFGYFVRKVPLLRSIVHQAKRGIRNILLPEEFGWVKVERGLAQAVWLRLRLLGEAAIGLATMK
jgi:hypothetical protein